MEGLVTTACFVTCTRPWTDYLATHEGATVLDDGSGGSLLAPTLPNVAFRRVLHVG